MKKIFLTLIGLIFSFSLFSGEVMLQWDHSPLSNREGYKLYMSTNIYPLPFQTTNYLSPVTSNVIVTVKNNIFYSFSITEYATNHLNEESEYSNQIRYQRFNINISKTNELFLLGSTNWNNIVLIKPPLYGVLIGTPPNLKYYVTNLTNVVKDVFVYQLSEKWSDMFITNYYSLHFQLPNRSPFIVQPDQLGF